MRAAIIAFSMYSRIPMPMFEWKEEDMKYAMCFFPVIGVVIGAVFYGMFLLLSWLLPGSFLSAGILLAVPIFITGGIHMDGFMDTCDARASYGDREKKLAILKDTHTGAFAVIFGALYLILYAAACMELDRETAMLVSIGFVISRSLSGLSTVTFPEARKHGMLADFMNDLFLLPAYGSEGVRWGHGRSGGIFPPDLRAGDPPCGRNREGGDRMKLLMIRHGATAGNLEKRYVGRTDEGLTEQAVSDLKEEALKLREIAGNVAVIVTSPMKRCLETAEILFPEKLYENVPRMQKAGLSECDFGKFEYKNYLELSGDAEYQHFIDTLGREGFPGGEATDAFKARTVKAFQEVWKEISSQAEREDDRTLVFVVHGGTIMAVMEAFSEEKKSYYDWQVGNGEGVLGKIDASDGQIRNARIISAE